MISLLETHLMMISLLQADLMMISLLETDLLMISSLYADLMMISSLSFDLPHRGLKTGGSSWKFWRGCFRASSSMGRQWWYPDWSMPGLKKFQWLICFQFTVINRNPIFRSSVTTWKVIGCVWLGPLHPAPALDEASGKWLDVGGCIPFTLRFSSKWSFHKFWIGRNEAPIETEVKARVYWTPSQTGQNYFF